MKGAWIVLALFLGSAATAVVASPRRLNESQAEALVLAALSPQQRNLPALEAVRDDAATPSRFMFFTAIWKGEPNGSVVVGSYAVDADTGDVFSSTRECYEEKNGRLGRLQARTRAELGLSASTYQRIKTRGPLCGA